jgi:regulator of protease activity HflC (stomatin/prohibitin superfamily)
MAEIKNWGIVRHLRADPTSHILYFRDGRLVASGRGLAFWFLPLKASLAEVPVDDREMSLLFHGRTQDFQDVTAQGVATYRIVDPEALAQRVDFTIDTRTGLFRRQPVEKIELRLGTLAQQHANDYVGTTPVRRVLSEGHARVREAVGQGLTEDARLAEMGIFVSSVRITSVRPTADLEKALEAPMREKIQQESDEAAFARRALAVEKERAIQENAMKTKIELARREEELIAQHGQNARRQAVDKAEAEKVAADALAQRARVESTTEADRVREQADASASSIKLIEGARAEAEAARMGVFRDVPIGVLLSLAAQELAGKLQHIDHLNLSPDALGPMLTNLIQASTDKLEGRREADRS